MSRIAVLLIPALLVFLVRPAAAENQTFEDVVKKVEAKVEPKEAKRGEAVKWTLNVELADGWHTYPTKQADAGAGSYVNKLRFPKDGGLVFVGELGQPKTVRRTEDGVKVEMVEGTGAWTRTFVVSPDAKPGKVKVPVKITILACADRCLPPKTITTEAELTISAAAPVPVDPKYRDEVNAARK